MAIVRPLEAPKTRRRGRVPSRLERRVRDKCRRLAAIQVKGFRPDEIEQFFEYRDDPNGFFRYILGFEPWAKQAEIAEAVRDNPRVAVAACYASGKTYLAAAILIWWVYTRTPALAVTTAPTDRQVKKILWRYIRKLIRQAKVKLPGKILEKEIKFEGDPIAFGFAGSSGHSVQGIHEAGNVLFIEDEAAGMDAELLEDFEGITAGEGSRHLKIGNPTTTSGPFYNCFENPKERKLWVLFNISAFDCPNVTEKRNVVPGLVDLAWIEKIRRRYGEDSPFWITRVLGKFFTAGGGSVVPAEWTKAALQRWADEELSRWDTRWPIKLGVDCGRTIDETVIALQRGRRVFIVYREVTGDITAIADAIERAVVEHDADVVNLDATGLGVGVFDLLNRRISDGTSPLRHRRTQINDVVFGRTPEDPEDKKAFAFLVDLLQWRMREAFNPQNPEALAIEDEELAKQLPIREWDLNSKGQIKVDTKKEVKRKGFSSPDLADAVMHLFHEGIREEIF